MKLAWPVSANSFLPIGESLGIREGLPHDAQTRGPCERQCEYRKPGRRKQRYSRHSSQTVPWRTDLPAPTVPQEEHTHPNRIGFLGRNFRTAQNTRPPTSKRGSS